MRRSQILLILGYISSIVINVMNGDGLLTNQAIIHDQSTVLLITCTRHCLLHPMLFKVVPDLISLILEPLSGGLPDVVSGVLSATRRLPLHLLLL